MAWITEDKITEEGLKEIYAWDDEKPKKLILVYRINRPLSQIIFYPRDEFCVKEILLDGFASIPAELAQSGYMQAGLQYYVNKKLSEFKVDTLTIGKGQKTGLRKVPKKELYKVVLSYADFQRLRDGLTKITTEAKEERSSFIDEEFHSLFPNKFKSTTTRSAARGRARRLVRSLDSSVITALKPIEVDQVVDFVADILAKRYTASGPRQKLLKAAKVKIDEIALEDVIKQFKKHLKDDVSEATWGQFLKKNLFLVDSKYIGTVPELNVMLASQRKVDFGMFDATGYLDLFEIKKSSTRLLAARQDRGNYYWHSDATKAIVQAEKYLFNANRKATALAEDLKRERKVQVEVVQPRAVVIMGSSKQLETDLQMKADFRVLRQSLKHIEIILYDELLTRLENQKTKLYTTPDIELKSSSTKS